MRRKPGLCLFGLRRLELALRLGAAKFHSVFIGLTPRTGFGGSFANAVEIDDFGHGRAGLCGRSAPSLARERRGGEVALLPFRAVARQFGGLRAPRQSRHLDKRRCPMPLTITAAGPEDHADWQSLFRAYAAFYKTDATGAEAQVWAWIRSETEPYWSDIARDETGQALGLVQYSLMHRSLSGGMVVYLSDLFTTPEARGKGVGRALIDHVIAFAKARGYSSVRWLTAETNAPARLLYDSYAPASGFILYSIAP